MRVFAPPLEHRLVRNPRRFAGPPVVCRDRQLGQISLPLPRPPPLRANAFHLIARDLKFRPQLVWGGAGFKAPRVRKDLWNACGGKGAVARRGNGGGGLIGTLLRRPIPLQRRHPSLRKVPMRAPPHVRRRIIRPAFSAAHEPFQFAPAHPGKAQPTAAVSFAPVSLLPVPNLIGDGGRGTAVRRSRGGGATGHPRSRRRPWLTCPGPALFLTHFRFTHAEIITYMVSCRKAHSSARA